MKFKTGDLVWVKFPSQPEMPDVVSGYAGWKLRCDEHPDHYFYFLEKNLCACGSMLRHRRDDYQQKESLGSIEIIRSLMKKEGALLVSA